jgi:asparagine synthase (glutamine-hydrolysing)
MTMAWGLEARVPFLDHELVELALRMPADLKVRGGGKYILSKRRAGSFPMLSSTARKAISRCPP